MVSEDFQDKNATRFRLGEIFSGRIDHVGRTISITA